MLWRIWLVAANTYREAVRARVLHGLLGLALLTAGYSLVVGAYALRNSARVVSDLGAASVSLYGVLVAVVLGATSLYRELELKTIFPILARPIRRPEYLAGKFLGTWLTIVVFIAANAGVLLSALALSTGGDPRLAVGVPVAIVASAGLLAFRSPRLRTYLPIAVAVALAVAGAFVAAHAPDDRRVLLASSALTAAEVAIVVAIATVFSSFSSPFLTALFTLGVFVVGRSADTLARLPERMFGEVVHQGAAALARVVPNLMVYVPPRPLLTGEASGAPLPQYVALASLQAIAWTTLLLGVASVLFRRRDFL